jgi:hypothetical protein
MPTVARGPSGIRIEQRYGEHPPPHFHAIQGNDEVMLRIADLGVEAGSITPVALSAVQSWGRQHQAELALNWVLATAQMPVERIAWP